MEVKRLEPLWEMADVLRVIEGLDVAPGAGDGDGIEELEEIEIECFEDGGGGAGIWGEFGPGVEGGLGAAENLVDVLCRTQLAGEVFGVAFIGEGELVFEVVEAVVARSASLCTYSFTKAVLHNFSVSGSLSGCSPIN